MHTRCNLGARYRWGIEGAFLVEKHQGYSYEHAFAKQWNAMKGYHYLMRLAYLLNTLARFSKELAELFSTFGVQAAIGLYPHDVLFAFARAFDTAFCKRAG